MQQAGSQVGGHEGVAAWVAANSADVLAYYPMSDASASGTLSDESGNSRDGTYGSGITTRSVDGETVADFPGGTTGATIVPYGAWMNTIAAVFLVIELDAGADFQMFESREDGTGAQRTYQHRVFWFTTNGRNEFIRIAGGVAAPTVTNDGSGGTEFSNGTRHTVGWWYDGTDIRLYVDGVPDSPTAISALVSSTAPLRIGHSQQSGSAVNNIDGAMGSFVYLSAADADTIPDLHAAWVG